jgi:trk system potassium uptake protein TrkA
VYVRALYGRAIRPGDEWTSGVGHVHVVVMGCGRVGSAIARRLEGIGHSVAVIDQDPEAFRRLGPEFGGRQVTGLGFDRQTLLAAGVDSAGAFAAVSSGDNSNIIAARVARETFGVEHVVARIYDSKRAEVYERMGIPSVATVPWTVNRLMRELLSVKVSELWREPTGKVLLMRVTVTDSWVGRPLSELEAASGARAAWLVRFGDALLPTASTVLQSGDHLVMAVTDELTERVHRAVETSPERRQH